MPPPGPVQFKARDTKSALLIITEENAGRMIRAYFPAKYEPDRSDTKDMEGWRTLSA